MTRFIDRLASLPIIMIAGACEASIVMVPCDVSLSAHPSAAEHVAVHKAHVTHKHHKHRHPKVGGRRGLHLAIARGMCPVYTMGEELGGPAGGGAFGGGWFEGFEGSTSSALDDYSGFAAGFVGVGGAVNGDDSNFELASPIAVYQTNNTTQVVEIFQEIAPPPLVPPCDWTPPPCNGVTPVPEASTWAMMLAGFAALIFMRWRRA